ncbi:MAG TPA: hypothetical protein HPP87_03150 [Planctomycetes bacterium]|nr:hypothetical protein [Planctomycetota bacterium]
MDSEQLEKYTSAITLSDMEVFVFPELMYSLVLANIMSPILWRWRQADSFRKLEGKSPYKKLMRLRQFIMDVYDFNLDLNTWGLTSKSRELKRFEKFISPDDIAASNALFGYHGDQYYFDVDIRRHFGLDKYDGDIIPYWKTETVEAMTAFALKDGYNTGAGECVSLAALYASAAFVVCQIPLEDIYMVLTPLHSQNYFDIQGGVLSNNRRLLTRTMWFNGTAISAKAQRALRNEQVTIVAHSTGYVHCFYDRATIDKKGYRYFAGRLAEYLSTEPSPLIFANFLRCNRNYQQYFQFCRHLRGEAMFVKADVLFHYEHGSNYRIADETFDKLLGEVSEDDYSPYKCRDRLCCEELMRFIEHEKIDLKEAVGTKMLAKYLEPFVPEAAKFVDELCSFLHVEAKLPAFDKDYVKNTPIELSVEQSRQEVIEYLSGIRSSNITADLAFYAYRDMESCDWEPFVKAAVERNPVSVEAAQDKPVEQVYDWLRGIPNESIYDGGRLAQPDEVVNYSTGDGVEKAITLANIIRNRDGERRIEVAITPQEVVVDAGEVYRFTSKKGLDRELTILAGKL